MAYLILRRGFMLRRVLVAGLLVSLLEGPELTHAARPVHCYNNDLNKNITVRCAFDATVANACTSYIITISPGNEIVEHRKTCSLDSRDKVECILNEGASVGFTSEGNCFKFHGTKNDLKSIVDGKCKGKRRSAPDGQQFSISNIKFSARQSTTDMLDLAYCMCNDAHGCNKNCKCDASYGICGAKPCAPRSSYKCHCEGIDTNFGCEKDGKDCGGISAVDGCYSVLLEGQPPYKDCPPALEWFNCMKKTMKSVWISSNDCLHGTIHEFNAANDACPNQDTISTAPGPLGPMSSPPPNTYVMLCHCTGENCNNKHLKFPAEKEKEKDKEKDKNSHKIDVGNKNSQGNNNSTLGRRILPLGITLMIITGGWSGF